MVNGRAKVMSLRSVEVCLAKLPPQKQATSVELLGNQNLSEGQLEDISVEVFVH